jgi:methionyl-tRNA formyltransferase
MDGSDHTGVSTMVLTEGMDEGPVLARKRVPIDPDDTAGSLGARLAGLGGELLVSSLLGYERGDLIPEPQDHSSATYAPKITEAEARVSWGASSRSVRDLIRGLNPSPGAWTTLRAERVKLHRAERAREEPALAPGELAAHKELWVGTGDGALVLSEVQLAGRKRMSGADLVRGLRLQPGERFD